MFFFIYIQHQIFKDKIKQILQNKTLNWTNGVNRKLTGSRTTAKCFDKLLQKDKTTKEEKCGWGYIIAGWGHVPPCLSKM